MKVATKHKAGAGLPPTPCPQFGDLPKPTPFNPVSRDYRTGDGRYHVARLLDCAVGPLADLATEDITVRLTLIPAQEGNAMTATAILSGASDLTLWQVDGDGDGEDVKELWLDSDSVALLRDIISANAKGHGSPCHTENQ
jgi:hypothetical protein